MQKTCSLKTLEIQFHLTELGTRETLEVGMGPLQSPHPKMTEEHRDLEPME